MKEFMRAFKRFLRRNMVPFITGGLLVLFIYEVMAGPTPDHKAPGQVKRFRKPLAFRKGQGLWYDIKDFQTFINTYETLIPFAANPNNKPDTTKYKWVIGFYWKITLDDNDNNNAKHGFCMVPTLVEKTTGKVIDYYEDSYKNQNEQFYNHSLDGRDYRKKLTDPPTNAFDNGQLWP